MSLTNSTTREKIQTALEPHLQDIKAGHDGKITDAILTILIESLPEKKQLKHIQENGIRTEVNKQKFYRYGGYDFAIDQIKAEWGK